jgi:hypothetical protein
MYLLGWGAFHYPSKVMQYLFCHALVIKAVTKSCPGPEEGSTCLIVGNHKDLKERVRQDTVLLAFWKIRSVTYSPTLTSTPL